MGCSASVGGRDPIQKQLARTEQDLLDDVRRLQEKSQQLSSVREHLELAEQCVFEHGGPSVDSLMAQLRAFEEKSRMELLLQRDRILQEQHQDLRNREAKILGNVYNHRRRANAERVEAARAAQEAVIAQHQAEADCAEREVRRLREMVWPLRRARDEAAAEARDVQEHDRAARAAAGAWAAGLEQRLIEARSAHVRAEQRQSDLESHVRSGMVDLSADVRQREEELRQRELLLRRKNAELADLSSQLLDLQAMFAEVNQQLVSDSARVDGLQKSLASRSQRKERELEQLEGMLEGAHAVLARVRDAVKEERGERLRLARQAEEEHQKTRQLLEALKRFKQRLKGLTPQALLGALGPGTDPKVLVAAAAAAASARVAASPRPTSPASAPGSPASVASLWVVAEPGGAWGAGLADGGPRSAAERRLDVAPAERRLDVAPADRRRDVSPADRRRDASPAERRRNTSPPERRRDTAPAERRPQLALKAGGGEAGPESILAPTLKSAPPPALGKGAPAGPTDVPVRSAGPLRKVVPSRRGASPARGAQEAPARGGPTPRAAATPARSGARRLGGGSPWRGGSPDLGAPWSSPAGSEGSPTVAPETGSSLGGSLNLSATLGRRPEAVPREPASAPAPLPLPASRRSRLPPPEVPPATPSEPSSDWVALSDIGVELGGDPDEPPRGQKGRVRLSSRGSPSTARPLLGGPLAT